MDISLAFSPCPNDTFIFDALIHQKIDCQGLRFIPHLADVEALNQAALQNIYQVSKLSYFGWGFCRDRYALLRAGSALGFGVGPLLISKDINVLNTQTLPTVFVAGEKTTSHFLLSVAYPQLKNKQFVLFADIEDKTLATENSLGLIIHENRFTYTQKGLYKIADLGEWWQNHTQLPIPLGGIVATKTFEPELRAQISQLIRKSIAFAQQNPQSSKNYIKSLAQELKDEVIQQHIDLYVNDFSLDLQPLGERAVRFLLAKAEGLNLIPRQEIVISG